MGAAYRDGLGGFKLDKDKVRLVNPMRIKRAKAKLRMAVRIIGMISAGKKAKAMAGDAD